MAPCSENRFGHPMFTSTAATSRSTCYSRAAVTRRFLKRCEGEDVRV